jgi:hypothetical protein
VELRVVQGYDILTLYILSSQNRILRGETIPLDQDVHVWFQMNNMIENIYRRGVERLILQCFFTKGNFSHLGTLKNMGLLFFFFSFLLFLDKQNSPISNEKL